MCRTFRPTCARVAATDSNKKRGKGGNHAKTAATKAKKTAAAKAAFLAAFEELGIPVAAAKAAEVGLRSVHRWRVDDDEFAAEYDECLNAAAIGWEDEARRRAIEGYDEPVFYQGSECGTKRKFSDTLLIFLLNGQLPHKYRPNHEVSANATIVVRDVDDW